MQTRCPADKFGRRRLGLSGAPVRNTQQRVRLGPAQQEPGQRGVVQPQYADGLKLAKAQRLVLALRLAGR